MRAGGTSRRRAAVVVAAVGAAVAIAGTASAQVIPLPVPTSTTSSTTTTTAPPPQGGGGSTTTTTAPPRPVTPPPGDPFGPPPPGQQPPPGTPPPPGTAPAPGTPGQPAPEPLPDGGDDTATPTVASGGFPAALRALMDSIVRTPANDTGALLRALAPLERFGLDPTQQAIVGFGRFPVAGMARYTHDWWFPRFGPGWRLHQGTDIFAPFGTPVRAPVDGRVRLRDGGLGGITVYVVEPDGTYWYLAHLSGRAPDLVEGAPVRTGQVVGFVGTSGNARGTPPHVHIQIHPGGGPPVDPKPVLDRLIADALANAPAVIAAYERAAGATGAVPAGAVAVPVPEEPDLEATRPPRQALLWASSFGSTGGALQLAEAEALRAAEDVDWATQQAAAEARAQAELRANAVLGPLTPRLLAAALDSRDEGPVA